MEKRIFGTNSPRPAARSGGALIALMGTWATVSYNQAQLTLQEKTSVAELKLRTVQALEKFFPLLVSEKPGEKEFAYVAFLEIGGEKFLSNIILGTGDKVGVKVLDRAQMAQSEARGIEDPPSGKDTGRAAPSVRPKTVAGTTKPISRLKLALQHEEEGFRKLLERDYQGAVDRFKSAEDEFPSFHQVYEIRRLLERERAGLEAGGSEKWKEVYRKIVSGYSWKAPPELLAELKSASD